MERGVYSLTNTMIQAMVVTASSSRARPDEAIHIKTERETKGVLRVDAHRAPSGAKVAWDWGWGRVP